MNYDGMTRCALWAAILTLVLLFVGMAADFRAAPRSVPAMPEVYPLDLGPVVTVYDRAAMRVWWVESRWGADPDWRIEGAAGERGEFRTTPIWEQDFSDIFSRDPSVDDPEQMLSDVADWLWFRAHHYNLPHPHTVERLVRLYQEGH